MKNNNITFFPYFSISHATTLYELLPVCGYFFVSFACKQLYYRWAKTIVNPPLEKVESKTSNEKVESNASNENVESKASNEKMEPKASNEKVESKASNENVENDFFLL
jgi:hypothetical protein